MGPVHTINDVQDTPPVPRNIKNRYCPGMTSFWDLDITPFDPRGRDSEDRRRRICMCTVLGAIFFFDVVSLMSAMFHLHILSFIVGAIIDIIGFLFMAGCLVRIGNAEGDRVVMGKTITRWHFDVFLMFCAFAYCTFLLSFIFNMGSFVGLVLPLPLWIVIFLVAWVATWDSNVSLA